MLNQKKVEIFLAKFHKSLAKQFLEVANNISSNGEFLEVALMQKQYIPFQILTLFYPDFL